MAYIAQGQGVINIDTSAGSLTDISADTEGFGIDVDVNVGEFFTLDNDWSKSLSGGRKASVDITVIGETGTGGGYDLLSDWFFNTAHKTARTLRIDQPDSVAGSIRYSGEFRLQSLGKPHQASAGSGDPVRTVARLVGDGAITRTVIT